MSGMTIQGTYRKKPVTIGGVQEQRNQFVLHPVTFRKVQSRLGTPFINRIFKRPIRVTTELFDGKVVTVEIFPLRTKR